VAKAGEVGGHDVKIWQLSYGNEFKFQAAAEVRMGLIMGAWSGSGGHLIPCWLELVPRPLVSFILHLSPAQAQSFNTLQRLDLTPFQSSKWECHMGYLQTKPRMELAVFYSLRL
jgi:hypothetical protein